MAYWVYSLFYCLIVFSIPLLPLNHICQMTRMRQRLKKKQEALADFFDFKIYIAFIFKDQKKGSALFEAADVVPIMANNYEDKIMKVLPYLLSIIYRFCFVV